MESSPTTHFMFLPVLTQKVWRWNVTYKSSLISCQLCVCCHTLKPGGRIFSYSSPLPCVSLGKLIAYHHFIYQCLTHWLCLFAYKFESLSSWRLADSTRQQVPHTWVLPHLNSMLYSLSNTMEKFFLILTRWLFESLMNTVLQLQSKDKLLEPHLSHFSNKTELETQIIKI